jgi:hypothetical protein
VSFASTTGLISSIADEFENGSAGGVDDITIKSQPTSTFKHSN